MDKSRPDYLTRAISTILLYESVLGRLSSYGFGCDQKVENKTDQNTLNWLRTVYLPNAMNGMPIDFNPISVPSLPKVSITRIKLDSVMVLVFFHDVDPFIAVTSTKIIKAYLFSIYAKGLDIFDIENFESFNKYWKIENCKTCTAKDICVQKLTVIELDNKLN